MARSDEDQRSHPRSYLAHAVMRNGPTLAGPLDSLNIVSNNQTALVLCDAPKIAI
jgi:hypothetical protein